MLIKKKKKNQQQTRAILAFRKAMQYSNYSAFLLHPFPKANLNQEQWDFITHDVIYVFLPASSLCYFEVLQCSKWM